MAEETIVKQTGMGFADHLPVPDPMPANPRAEEYRKYKEIFFDPKYDGFGSELEYICDLPHPLRREGCERLEELL